MEQRAIRWAAWRGLVLPVLTVAVLVGGIAGGRVGTGASALAVMASVATAVVLVLGALAAAVVAVASRVGGRVEQDAAAPSDDLAARWARVEPVWSARR